ncbi:hypothetical protein [Deinococcus sp. QL22]|uniref:hypothetical protein n=1 Tax=Deinococcus sp. QL22 TaxID=2939437 RepID=UPI002016E173|nr:hypothetical protein [Deinococcus sp. QL22]UQN07939.1 hypothetical protein M1R55_17715 [Deinococcus sp. QL22]
MSFVLASLLSLTAQVTPTISVGNAHTPSTLVNSLAVKRNWTLEDNVFCRNRAASNATIAYPQKPTSKLKFIKTFGFRGTVNASLERSVLDITNVGFQVPFPWNDGQWLSRQYTAQSTPRFTYLLEMQDRPRQEGTYSTLSSVCITVFGVR